MATKNPRARASYRALIALLRLGGLLRKAGDRFFASYDLTLAQFNVLVVLKYETPKGCTQVDLCRHLLVKPANMTGLVRRMEARGLLRRDVDPEDERVWLVRISEKGRQLLGRVESSYYENVDRVMGIHSESDLRRLSGQLERTEEAVARLG